MPPELNDVMPSAALVFTVLTFFAGKRWEYQLQGGRTKPLSVLIVANAVPEFLVAAASALAAIVLWPLLKETAAFSTVTDAHLALANLFAIVWAGFVLLCLAMASLVGWRMLGGLYLHSRTFAVLAIVLVMVGSGYGATRIL